MTRFANLPSFSETEAARVKRSLSKASALDVADRKYERKVSRQGAKKSRVRAEREKQAEIRVFCYRRDGGRCRATGVPLKLTSDNPHEVAHCHHIKYRSAGGSDTPENRVTLSPRAHEDEHRHKLSIKGDPNGTLTFRQWDIETGRIIREWESVCPSQQW